jgi:hypothetical protein
MGARTALCHHKVTFVDGGVTLVDGEWIRLARDATGSTHLIASAGKFHAS